MLRIYDIPNSIIISNGANDLTDITFNILDAPLNFNYQSNLPVSVAVVTPTGVAASLSTNRKEVSLTFSDAPNIGEQVVVSLKFGFDVS